MADEQCQVTVVFKSGERATVWMSRATLDQLTADFTNSIAAARKVYPLLDNLASSAPSPRALAVIVGDIAYIT